MIKQQRTPLPHDWKPGAMTGAHVKQSLHKVVGFGSRLSTSRNEACGGSPTIIDAGCWLRGI
jgi:hypothetical protein